MSPIIWNIVFDEFLEKFKEGPIKVHAYADDAALVVEGPDPTTMASLMQSALKDAERWGNSADLRFSASKTVAMLFTRKKKYETPRLTMSGQTIQFSTKVKYLGLWLTSKLTWDLHVTQKLNAALRNAIGKLWGPSPQLTRWAYVGMARPIILYCSHVFVQEAVEGKWKQKFERLNRMAVTMLAPMRKGTPTAGLEVLAYIMPLKFCILQEAVLTYERVTKIIKSQWDGLPDKGKRIGHLRWLKNWRDKHGFTSENSDGMTPKYSWEQQYKVDSQSMGDGTPGEKGDITVYTDGSKTEGQLGFGFYIDTGQPEGIKEKRSLGTKTTVFQAELHAIKAAAEMLAEVAGKRVIIYSDSQAAIKALDNPIISSYLVDDTRVALNTAVQQCGKDITIRWVKAHAGHPGNEMADQLAKEGALNPGMEAEQQTKIPVSYWKQALRELIEQKWTHQFQTREDCRQSKLWLVKVDKNKSKMLLKLPRKELGEAIQCITGHAFLRKHQWQIDKSVPMWCRHCDEEEETPWHLATECPGTLMQRRLVFNDPASSTEDPAQWKVYQLSRFVKTIVGPLFLLRAE